MPGYEIELRGGPADGEIRVIDSDRRELRFLLPVSLSPIRWEEEMGPPQQLETMEVVYLRTRKMNRAGYRIYEYRK